MNYSTYKLDNGVRVLEVPVVDAKSVTVLVLFGVGSRYESRAINGLSHFLEHMFFKGTTKRPKAEMIAEEVDAVGGEMNAFTSKEFTGYYIKAAAQHGAMAVEILSDMLLNSLFDPSEIDRERGVITQEISMYEDQPMIYAGELFETKLFGDTPLGWQVIGTRENITRLTREEFLKHKDAYYNAGNMLVVVAGGVGEAKKNIQSHFSAFSGGSITEPPKNQSGTNQSPFHMYVKKTEQTHLWVGFRGVAQDHPDRFALRILSSILGGGMSSRMFLSVRERKGLAYYVRCQVEHYRDTGFIAASAGVTSEKFEEAVATIMDEFRQIRDEKVSDKELSKAKEYVKGKLLLQVEQSDQLAEMLGLQEILLGTIMTPEQYNQHIDAVTAADITRVAETYLTQAALHAAVISADDHSTWLNKNLRV